MAFPLFKIGFTDHLLWGAALMKQLQLTALTPRLLSICACLGLVQYFLSPFWVTGTVLGARITKQVM